MSDKVDGMDLTPPDSSTPKTSPNDQRESQEVAQTPTSSIDEDSSVEEKKPSPSCDKKVHFPQDGKLVHSVFEGGEAWRLDPSVPNEEVIDRYAAHAYSLDRKPISSIIEQLSKMTIPFALYTFAAFVFKGTQLALPDIEALEEIFKYCHATHLSFENTNLERKALAALLEIIDYYACCSELCLARNKGLDSPCLKILASFLNGYPGLIWLDLRGVPILMLDAQVLGQGIRGQFVTTRVHLRKSVAKRLTQRCMAASKQAGATDAESPSSPPPPARSLTKAQTRRLKDLIRRFFTTPSGKTEVQLDEVADLLKDVPTLCLRGLHLGETGICGPSLSELSAAIRIAGQLSDLRLPSNGLQPGDVKCLVNLIRYHAGLEVLDLSYNQLGDEGCQILASALSTASYASTAIYDYPSTGTKRSTCNLRRLYLAANDVRQQGATALAGALPMCRRLTHLELSDNEHLQCAGFAALQPGLHKRRGLRYLGLARCDLACAGAIALAELLGDSPRALRRIKLAGNHIAEAGLLAISRSVPFCTSLICLEGLEENWPKSRTVKSPRSSVMSPLRQRPSKPTPLVSQDMSELSLEILHGIHHQLALNIDARLGPPGTSPAPSPSPSSLDNGLPHRTFRGYVRFSVIGHDPRHLCGDSDLDDNEEENEEEEKLDEVVDAEQPTQPQEGKKTEKKTDSDPAATAQEDGVLSPPRSPPPLPASPPSSRLLPLSPPLQPDL